jgi:hypothetical protein
MPIAYTNRKGQAYYLCQGMTKTGKQRYYFTTKAEDNRVERIPKGYAISESVNGIVSLVKERPQLILEREIVLVKKAIQKHPQTKNYRISVKPNRIEIYEHVGPDLDNLFTALQKDGLIKLDANLKGRLQEEDRVYGQFTPVMRFIVTDEQQRFFKAQRMCYRRSIDDWIDIDCGKSIDVMAPRLIPKLGKEEFFELF